MLQAQGKSYLLTESLALFMMSPWNFPVETNVYRHAVDWRSFSTFCNETKRVQVFVVFASFTADFDVVLPTSL